MRGSMAHVFSGVTPVSALTVDCAAVDFDLSTDQQALRDAAVTLLDRMAGHDALRARVGAGSVVGTLPGAGEAGQAGGAAAGSATAGDAPAGYDTAAWAAMAEQGWLALEIPEDEGGLGMGLVEIAVLCEEIGRRLAAVPFLSSVVALGALERTRGAFARVDEGMARGLEPGGSRGLCRPGRRRRHHCRARRRR